MEYRQIVAVTGLSGLYQLMSTKNDGAIVKSLVDKSVKFVSARIHNITPLESIEIYTTDDNVRLHEVFEKIKENDAQVLAFNTKKDDKAAKAYFKEILPNFDEDRVYTSDIKKLYKWYEILKNNDLLNFDYLKQTEAEQSAAEEVVKEEVVAQKPAKKATKKAAKPATDEVVSSEEAGEAESAPKKATKKRATKKSTPENEEGEKKPAKKTAKKKSEDKEA